MISTNKTTFSILSYIVITISVSLLLLLSTPPGLDPTLRTNWILDSLCLGISILSLIVLIARGKSDMLGAPVFLGILYIIMFFITPLYDISIGETAIFGVTDLFDYGVKGSTLALLGFLVFCLIYDLKVERIEEQFNYSYSDHINYGRCKSIALIMWVVLFVVGMVCTIMTTGFSVSYILSFGLLGDANEYEKGSTLLGFIIQFTRGVVPLSLILYAISKRKGMALTIVVLTALYQVISGFRYMIVIMICGFFYYSFISRNKKVTIYHILILSFALSLIVGIVGYSRNSVRAGQGFYSVGFGKEAITDAVVDNFRIYKSYYGILKAVPSMTEYLYFDQMVNYTAIMLIPRAIWPKKPSNPGTEAQLYSMGEEAINNGYAYPNLGEYYYSFGVIGVLFFMALFGLWLAQVTNRYRYHARSLIDITWYCIAIPMTMQLLIRGYTPSNFYLIIALIFPSWFINRQVQH